MIDLSIIIVNHNGRGFLEDCLNSVFKNTHQAEFEMIFVDNNSSDNSVEFVRTNFPSVRIIENKENIGFSGANNQGLKIYQGRYALLLNADTIVKEGALDQMLEFMDKNPKAGACGPRLVNRDGTPQHQGGLFARKFWLSKVPVKVDYILGACLMVRREVIDKVGGLDENFFFSNEDLDWCRRIRPAGWDVYFVPQPEVVHFGGFTIKSFDRQLFIEGFRGGLYFCEKHYGPLAYQTYRFLLASAMLLAVFFSIIFYPLIKNKQKPGAFWQIFLIALKDETLPENPKREKMILLVSNGHAEDLAASAIGAELRKILPEFTLKAIPLVGLGKAYDDRGIENLGLSKTLPSGGFAKEGLIYLLQDLWAGLLQILFQQAALLNREGKKADLVLAVGDVYVVALCGFFIRKPLIFVDGPKSVKIEGYFNTEKWLMRKFCKQIVVQDQETADYLKKLRLPAQFLGSWVMDYVPVTGEDFGLSQEQPVIGILPGTRGEAYDNLLLILKVFEEMNRKEKFLGLAASALDREKIKAKIRKTGWNFSETSAEEKSHGLTGKLVSKSGTSVLIAEGKFGDVCLRSKLIIGLAGIANEQAVAFGRPVVCFPGKGAQTTLRRFQEIQKITGDSMLIFRGRPKEIAEKALEVLHSPKHLEEMGRIGKESKPVWGGVKGIAQLVRSVSQ